MDMVNPPHEPPEPTELPSLRITLRRVFAVLLLVIVAGTGLILVVTPPTPAVTVMPLPEGWPTPKPSLSARLKSWIPMWFWRLKGSLTGPAKTFTIEAALFEFSAGFEAGLPDLPLEHPTFKATNGLRVWLLETNRLADLRQRLKEEPGSTRVSTPRVTTAHGVQSRMFVGNSMVVDGSPIHVGTVMNFLPRVRREVIDLSAIMTLSEGVTNQIAVTSGRESTNVVTVRTNLAVAVRLQMPPGSGALLLDADQTSRDGKRMGVLISIHRP